MIQCPAMWTHTLSLGESSPIFFTNSLGLNLCLEVHAILEVYSIQLLHVQYTYVINTWL